MGRNMFRNFIVIVLALMVVPDLLFAKDIVVGDDRGWTLGFDYTAWAAKQNFSVGDVLVFNYAVGIHNVNDVDENSYTNCIIPATGALTSGADRVTLQSAGTRRFICGIANHCKINLKLRINVQGTPDFTSFHS